MLTQTCKFLHHIVSPCAINPCKNGGKCLPIAGDDFTCRCPEGFYGDTCEKSKYMVTIILTNFTFRFLALNGEK